MVWRSVPIVGFTQCHGPRVQPRQRGFGLFEKGIGNQNRQGCAATQYGTAITVLVVSCIHRLHLGREIAVWRAHGRNRVIIRMRDTHARFRKRVGDAACP